VRTVHLEITADDIERGERANCQWCPVALALRRAFPGRKVVVWHDRAEIAGRPYWLPQSVRDFVTNYDDDVTPMRTPARPLSFELVVEDALFEGS
jgi:hypothetical protein